MAPPGQGDGDGVGDGRREEGGGGFGQKISGIIRIAVFWYFASKLFSSKKAPSSSDPASVALFSNNLFHKSEPIDLWVYVSQNATHFSEFADESALLWHQSNIPYATWSPESSRSVSLMYRIPPEVVERNASLFAHVFFSRSGYPVDPSDPEYMAVAAFYGVHPLVTYLPRSKAEAKRSLLKEADAREAGEESSKDKDKDKDKWVSFWKPNVTINLVDDFTAYPRNAVPPNIAPFLNVDSASGDYFPTVYFNEFWLLRDKLVEINETSAAVVPLHLEVGPISLTKWQLFVQMEQSFQMQRSYGSMVEGEADQLKRVLLEGNPYLLGVTMLVSMLHSIFDFLAFKNDIQFWNKNKSMEGLSARTVVVSFVSQLIVFLYLLDNDTSWMILASSAVGCCIEFWKIGKAMHIEVDRSGRLPMLRFRDRDSYSGNKTKEYDDMAMKYLSYLLFFLVGCSAVYTLMYERHKSWYSWILNSLTSCVYMFGFIMMCPQLFINYKLKSVAHLPWRQMTYKFLNTIIDDLFAFVIKMPTLHRLSVFRDDLIFLIYIYQRWIYPVDNKRVNEFGFGGDAEPQLIQQPTADTEDKKTN